MPESFSAHFPPHFEQTAVVAFVDKASVSVGTAITRSHCPIELLQEYRIRLIAHVVTRKVDVREAATALPEVDPMGAQDDLDDTFDTGTTPPPKAR